jgi:hypothetical protein
MPFDSEFQRADGGVQTYGDDMRKYLRDLSDAYEFFIEEKMKLHYDEELFTECLASMITIMSHLLPKLSGGGTKTERVYRELKTYEHWMDDVMIPKLSERGRVTELYKLILEAYDLLGLSSLG